MEVKPGYKLTEVGVIPEDWEVKPLGKIATLQRGFDLPYRLRRRGDVPIVTSSGIEDWHDVAKVNSPGVVTGRYGTIGEVFYLTCDYWPHNTSLYVRDFHGNSPRYIFYVLTTIDFASHSGKSGVPGVNRNDLHEEILAIPPTLAEQEAIAEALSDADALVAGLEQLIAKKRHVKQGAMQELLTGKRRLPGFSGKWETKRLGEIATKVGSGITPTGGNRVYSESGRHFIRSQNVGWGMLLMDDIAFIDDQTHKSFDATEIQLHDVFLNITGASIGRSAVADERIIGGNVNQHVCIIRVSSDEADSKFVNMFLLSTDGQRQIDSFQAGGNRQGLNFAQVRSLELDLPSLAEQTAIAAVLTDMANEIAALEERLAKAKMVKQGMMQELLTGKTRLL